MALSLFFAIKVSTVIIVITSYLVYTMYNNSFKTPKYNSWKATCPDYWDIIDKNKCRNTRKIGKCLTGENNIMDFNETIFNGKEGDYYKCRWAVKCEAPWEGIDNLCS